MIFVENDDFFVAEIFFSSISHPSENMNLKFRKILVTLEKKFNFDFFFDFADLTETRKKVSGENCSGRDLRDELN